MHILCVFRNTLLSTFLKKTHSGWLLVPKYTSCIFYLVSHMFLSKSEETYSMAIFHVLNVPHFSTPFLTFPCFISSSKSEESYYMAFFISSLFLTFLFLSSLFPKVRKVNPLFYTFPHFSSSFFLQK